MRRCLYHPVFKLRGDNWFVPRFNEVSLNWHGNDCPKELFSYLYSLKTLITKRNILHIETFKIIEIC